MLILSQHGKFIFNMETMTLMELKENSIVGRYNTNMNFYVMLATYRTPERAKEALQDIWKHYDTNNIYKMPGE